MAFKRWARGKIAAELRAMMQIDAERDPVPDRRPLGARGRSRDERQAIYEAAWEKGRAAIPRPRSATCWSTRRRTTPPPSSSGQKGSRRGRRRTRGRRRNWPKSTPFASRAAADLDTGYFETFQPPDNVALVENVSGVSLIECITPDGIRAGDGTEHRLDVIVFATGFDAIRGPGR